MAKELMVWARRQKDLKISSAPVHSSILPSGFQAELHDVRVFSKHGPDDDIYNKHAEFRKKVPRGGCFLDIRHDGRETTKCVIFALKKFTGGLGDDDDCDNDDEAVWQKYFTRDISQTSKVVALQKANGDAAHMSVVEIGGEQFIVGGSKNVHMLLKSRTDIDLYTDSRYQVARDVCYAIFDMLDDMNAEHRHRLLTFLTETGYTCVFEILSPHHQHVEDLSHLKRSELVFIAWTAFDVSESGEHSLCALAPDEALEKARSFGLITVEFEVLTASQVDERLVKIRNAYGYEGEVLYFMDSCQAVIGLLKKKTVWYVLTRAIREKVRMAVSINKKDSSTFSKASHCGKLCKRLTEIQKWIGFDDQFLQRWQTLGQDFLRWCIEQQDGGHLTVDDISNLFPVTWKRFLHEKNLSDRFELELVSRQSLNLLNR